MKHRPMCENRLDKVDGTGVCPVECFDEDCTNVILTDELVTYCRFYNRNYFCPYFGVMKANRER